MVASQGVGGEWHAVYRLDWIEQLKLRLVATPASRQIVLVSPVVWSLGFTSFLTDISSEMVTSALPAYLFLHLRLSPLQYGVIDGLYNGFAIAVLSLAAGFMADRLGRHKEVALAGYGISAVCKLLLPASGAAWGWIAAVIALDRSGKGMRSAPRDALISRNSSISGLASAFGVHRAMDAGGALLGPLIAFALLAFLPGAFDVLWSTSFVFAVLGVGALWLFVPASKPAGRVPAEKISVRSTLGLLADRRFRVLVGVGTLFAAFTVSDAFVYLLLQQHGAFPAGYMPLNYVGTACAYMLFSIPVGLCADAWGRSKILVAGYAVLLLIYGIILLSPSISLVTHVACIALLGLYYAGTEGVLMAMGSVVVPERLRGSGLALIGTAIGLGKVVSSIAFGWLWSRQGASTALMVFTAILLGAITMGALWLHRSGRESTR
jgi:MFS family permease